MLPTVQVSFKARKNVGIFSSFGTKKQLSCEKGISANSIGYCIFHFLAFSFKGESSSEYFSHLSYKIKDETRKDNQN